MEPAEYDDLDYHPVSGEVSVSGREGEWSVTVPVEQGRAMEEDGIPVYWTHTNYPKWVVELGLTSVWGILYRVWTFPAWALRKDKNDE